jgi:hypothetical protein
MHLGLLLFYGLELSLAKIAICREISQMKVRRILGEAKLPTALLTVKTAAYFVPMTFWRGTPKHPRICAKNGSYSCITSTIQLRQ